MAMSLAAAASARQRLSDINPDGANYFIDKLLFQIYEHFDEQYLTDVTFKLSNPTALVTAHRLILSAASPYFKEFFKSDSGICPLVDITDIDSDTFERLITFCYTGKALITIDNVDRMLKAALILQLHDAVTNCVDFVIEHITDYRLERVYTLERDTQCRLLSEKILEYEIANFMTVIQSAEFLNFGASKLQTILESDDLNVPTEKHVFEAVKRWYEYDASVRKEFLPDIISYLRLTQFDTNFIMKNVKPLPGCLVVALQAVSWVNVPSARDDLSLRSTNQRSGWSDQSAFLAFKTSQRHLCRTVNMSTAYAQPKDIVMSHQCMPHTGVPSISQQPSSDDMYGNYVYARPLPKADRTKYNVASKYERNSYLLDVIDNNDKQMYVQSMELKDNNAPLNGVPGTRRKVSAHTNETSDMSYDSNFDDFVFVGHSEHPTQRSPTQASKNQDGVGSFESWNYVFKNLERSGYSKDLGERGDLLVQGLDLDSMNISNGGGANVSGPKATVERRRSNNVDLTNASRQTNNDLSKARTLDKTTKTAALRGIDKRDEKKVNTSNIKQQNEKSILKQPGKKTKSALKQTLNAGAPSSHDNNGNDEVQIDKNIRTKNRKQNAANIQSSMSSQSEWSCPFCTFLNPETKRICEMCCRSKDFNLETTASHTPTCV